jgi:cyclic pyranopterin phosphate synthase
MMPIGHGREYMDSEAPDLLQQLEQRYGKAAALQQNLRGTQEMKERSLTENHAEGIRILGSGPAEYYRFDDLREPIGLIRSIHHRFCENCNRVRLTSEGQLKQCLCFESGIDLRQILREGSETNTKYVSEKVDTGTEGVRDRIAEKLQQCMYQAIYEKPSGHCFQNLQGITEEKVMGKIGG